ncbi:MAG: SoxR reducing system RseC family protein [Tannerella sp.]|nr:SoxR reducing system RseC family protein [Tannerella sp.]
MKNDIRHQGIVEKVEKHKVFIRVEQQAACSACHARSACAASEKKDRIIEVDDDSGRYAVNERVLVSVQSAAGFLAVILAFVIPLALVVAALTAGAVRSGSEAVGGLAGLAILIPYYPLLYVFRGRLKKKFIFSLSKV